MTTSLAAHQVARLEGAVADLARALKARDSNAVEQMAGQLQATLAGAAEPLARAARQGVLPPELGRRLAHLREQVALRREAVHREGVALDRLLQPLRQDAGAPAYAAGTFAPTPGNLNRPA